VTEQLPGLIRADRALERRKQYIQQHWGDLKSASVEPDDDASKARWLGYQAGRATEIRSGVESGSAGQTEALPTGETKLLG